MGYLIKFGKYRIEIRNNNKIWKIKIKLGKLKYEISHFPTESPEIHKNHTVILADGLGGFGVNVVMPHRCRLGT